MFIDCEILNLSIYIITKFVKRYREYTSSHIGSGALRFDPLSAPLMLSSSSASWR